MLVEIFFYIIYKVLEIFTLFLPANPDTLLKLPWGLDELLVNGVAAFKSLVIYFPPLTTLMTAFLIYLGIRVALRLLSAVPILGRTIKD